MLLELLKEKSIESLTLEDVEKLFNAGIATIKVAHNQIAFIQE